VTNRTVAKTKRNIKLNGKCIGFIEGDAFVKYVWGSCHQLRQPPAWCLSYEIFEKEVKPCVTKIVIKDTESGLTYVTSTENFTKYCFEIQRGGYEKQVACGLKHFQIEGNGHKQLSLWGDGGNAQ
jgi:hypothetical protein